MWPTPRATGKMRTRLICATASNSSREILCRICLQIMSMTNRNGRLRYNNNSSNLCGSKTCSRGPYVSEAEITPTLASHVAQLTIRVPARQSHNFSTSIRSIHAHRALSSSTNSTRASRWRVVLHLSRLMILQTLGITSIKKTKCSTSKICTKTIG